MFIVISKGELHVSFQRTKRLVYSFCCIALLVRFVSKFFFFTLPKQNREKQNKVAKFSEETLLYHLNTLLSGSRLKPQWLHYAYDLDKHPFRLHETLRQEYSVRPYDGNVKLIILLILTCMCKYKKRPDFIIVHVVILWLCLRYACIQKC